MRKLFASLALAGGLALAALPALAADANPFIGSWVLNIAKSTFNPGPAPKSGTRKTEDLGNGMVKTTIDTVQADGTTMHAEGTYAFDGKDYPVTGNAGFDAVSVKRVDVNTVEVTRKLAGKASPAYKVQVSADGKTLTQTMPGTGADGSPAATVTVYDRQ